MSPALPRPRSSWSRDRHQRTTRLTKFGEPWTTDRMSRPHRPQDGRVRDAFLGGMAVAVGLLVAAVASAANMPAVGQSRQAVPFSVGTFHGGYVVTAAALRAIAAAG